MNRAHRQRLAAIRAIACLAMPPVHHEVHMQDDPIRDAHEHVKQAIAELKAAGVTVPIALHKAAHALSYATETLSIFSLIATGLL